MNGFSLLILGLIYLTQVSAQGDIYCYSCSDLVATLTPEDSTLKGQIESGSETRCSNTGDAFMADPPGTTLCQPYDATYDAFCMKSDTTTDATLGGTSLTVTGVERSCLIVPKNESLSVGCQAPPQYMYASLASSGFGNLSISGNVCLCTSNLCNVYGVSSPTNPPAANCNTNGESNTVTGTQPAWGIRNACAVTTSGYLSLFTLVLLWLNM